MNETLQKVYLVRHGETAWSLSGQHTGHTDIPLNERGQHAAKELRSRLQGLTFIKVLTSPLQRARRTGELAGFGEAAMDDPDLMEWNYGDYEGLRTVDIQAQRQNWRLFENGCPGGETLEQVATRTDRVIARVRALKRDVLIFSHGHVLRILIARWIKLPAIEARRLHLATASVSIMGYDHDLNEPVIRLLNDTRRSMSLTAPFKLLS